MATNDSTLFDPQSVRRACDELQSMMWLACQEAKATKINPGQRAIFEDVSTRLSALARAIEGHADVDLVNHAHSSVWPLQELMLCARTSTGDGHDFCALESLFVDYLNQVRECFGLRRHGAGAIKADPEDVWVPSSNHAGPQDSQSFKTAGEYIEKLRLDSQGLRRRDVNAEKQALHCKAICSHASNLEWAMQAFDEENRPRTNLSNYSEELSAIQGAACLLQTYASERASTVTQGLSKPERYSAIGRLVAQAEEAYSAIAASSYVREAAEARV